MSLPVSQGISKLPAYWQVMKTCSVDICAYKGIVLYFSLFSNMDNKMHPFTL